MAQGSSSFGGVAEGASAAFRRASPAVQDAGSSIRHRTCKASASKVMAVVPGPSGPSIQFSMAAKAALDFGCGGGTMFRIQDADVWHRATCAVQHYA